MKQGFTEDIDFFKSNELTDEGLLKAKQLHYKMKTKYGKLADVTRTDPREKKMKPVGINIHRIDSSYPFEVKFDVIFKDGTKYTEEYKSNEFFLREFNEMRERNPGVAYNLLKKKSKLLSSVKHREKATTMGQSNKEQLDKMIDGYVNKIKKQDRFDKRKTIGFYGGKYIKGFNKEINSETDIADKVQYIYNEVYKKIKDLKTY